MAKMIYSISLDEMVVAGFTRKDVYFDVTGKKPYEVKRTTHYTWNDMDCCYYNDDTDEKFFFDVPNNGKSLITVRPYYHRRMMIICDK